MKKIILSIFALLFANLAIAQTVVPPYGVSSGITPILGGTDKRVLFDDNGVIGESANLTFDKTNSILTLGADVNLIRQAANTLALRNGVNAQMFNIYATYTDASNYAYLRQGFDGSSFILQGGRAGTGTSYSLQIGLDSTNTGNINFATAGTNKIQLNTSGNLLWSTDNTNDIGASGATRPRNVYVGSTVIAASTIQSTAGNIIGNGIAINRSGTTYASILDNGDGIMRFYNGAATGFTGIQLGGTTASFPYIKRVTTGVEIKLADDSAYTTITSASALAIGAGQATASFDTAGALGGSILLGDSGAGANNGGAIVFAANSQAWRFAAIKGLATSGSNNTQGDIVISTRRVSTDAALTEAIRIKADGSLTTSNVIKGKLTTDTNYTAGLTVGTGYLTIYDAAGTAYKVNACTGC